jgi:hypothetical protein
VKVNWRLQRTEKLSVGRPGAGAPAPHWKPMNSSLRVNAGLPLRVGLP